MFENKTIAFIGSGQMAEAMIAGIIDQKIMLPEQVIAAGPREERARELAARYNIRTTTDNREAAREANLLVLSAKPQILDEVLPAPPETGAEHCDFVLSIAAGVSLGHLVARFGNERMVRAMPNTPAKIGEGITVWTATQAVGEQQRSQARAILQAFGEEVYVDHEDNLDMATALSGTGPSYFFMLMEAMVDAGVHLGFSRRIARKLVFQTALGAVLYARATDEHLVSLRNQVTSPGGTSAEALYHLEKGGFRTVVSRAVWAAYQRSVALGGGKKVSQRLGSPRPGTELDNDI
ncbi:MAG: pyrroline-5-carboxylate reductase [Chloroflexi bacterium]|nr:pyrroline-5-carboxylate reductase [Chloroflexota bacterium]